MSAAKELAAQEDFEAGYNDGSNGRPFDPPPFSTGRYEDGYRVGKRERDQR